LFWWVEAAEPKETNVIFPVERGEIAIPEKPPHPAITKATVWEANSVSVHSGSYAKVTVWLSPEIVQFNDSLTVTINNKRSVKIQPCVDTLLEDVRTRGDRQHPFWAKVENLKAQQN